MVRNLHMCLLFCYCGGAHKKALPTHSLGSQISDCVLQYEKQVSPTHVMLQPTYHQTSNVSDLIQSKAILQSQSTPYDSFVLFNQLAEKIIVIFLNNSV